MRSSPPTQPRSTYGGGRFKRAGSQSSRRNQQFPNTCRGALYAIAAVSMWTAWILAVRLGIRTSLTPWDITAIRFGVAGLILLPYLLKKGLAVDRLRWTGLAAILLGGAPTVLVSYGGLVFAPAAHAASLFTAPHTSLCRGPSRCRAGRD